MLNAAAVSFLWSIPAQPTAAAPNQAISIATINAAVVAVVFGAFVAYAAILIQREHELRDAVFDAAHGINLLGMRRRTFTNRQEENQDLLGGYDARDRDQRTKMMMRLMTVPAFLWSDRFLDPAALATIEPDVGARRAAEIMMILGGSYPFPSRYGYVDGTMIPLVDVVPVSFSDLDAIDEWAFAVRDLVFLAPWPSHVRRNSIRRYLSVGDTVQDETMGFGQLAEMFPAEFAEDLEQQRRETSSLAVLDDFEQLLTEASEVVHRTILERDRYRRYRSSRFAPRFWGRITAAAVVALVILVLGVLVPIVSPTAPRWTYAWLPAAVYLGAAVATVIWLSDRLLKTRSDPVDGKDQS